MTNEKEIITFEIDPMIKMMDFRNIKDKIFYLNETALNEIRLYSYELKEGNIPGFFNYYLQSGKKEDRFFLLAAAGIDEEGEEYPETYFAMENTEDEDYPSKIIGMYSLGQFYIAPDKGREIYLNMVKGKVKTR